MAKTIENLFLILHYSGDILIIVLFFLYYKRTKTDKVLNLITIYSFIELVLNIFTSYFTENLYLYIWSTFTLIEYSIFSFVLWRNIKKESVRMIILICSICFIIFTTIFNIVTNFRSIDSIPIGIETILILIYSFYYLYEQLNDSNNLFIYNKYQFWIIIGFMIYLAGSFFVFLFASRMEHERELLRQYWFLTNGFYIIMNIMIAIGFFIRGKSSSKEFSQKLHPYLN